MKKYIVLLCLLPVIAAGQNIGIGKKQVNFAPGFPHVFKDGVVYLQSYEPEALSLFSRMIIEPSSVRKRLDSDFIDSLKTNSCWDSLAVIYVFTRPYIDQSILQIKGNYYNVTAKNYPIFKVDTGFYGYGTTSYLNIGFNPSTDSSIYKTNKASIFVYNLSNDLTNGRTIVGIGTTNRDEITILTSQVRGRINNTTTGSIVYNHSNNILGLLSLTRNGNTIRLWQGGTIKATASVPPTGKPTGNIVFLNLGASVATYLGGISFAAIGNLQRASVLNRIVEWYMDELNIGVQ